MLSAPIDTPSHVADDDSVFPKHIAKDGVGKVRRFRNLIHPARALKEGFDPAAFTREQLYDWGIGTPVPSPWLRAGRDPQSDPAGARSRWTSTDIDGQTLGAAREHLPRTPQTIRCAVGVGTRETGASGAPFCCNLNFPDASHHHRRGVSYDPPIAGITPSEPRANSKERKDFSQLQQLNLASE